MTFESPASYIPDLVGYFNLEFFGASWKNVSNIFTKVDFTFVGELSVSGVPTLFYRVEGEKICGTISSYNGGIMIGMDYLPE